MSHLEPADARNQDGLPFIPPEFGVAPERPERLLADHSIYRDVPVPLALAVVDIKTPL